MKRTIVEHAETLASGIRSGLFRSMRTVKFILEHWIGNEKMEPYQKRFLEHVIDTMGEHSIFYVADRLNTLADYSRIDRDIMRILNR